MATASASAESLIQNEDLRRRLLFTLFCLLIYRLGVHIPTPGINGEVVKSFFEGQGGLFGLFNTFTGGALNQFSVFALGIMPYISASIIFQLLTATIPYLEALKKEGQSGQRKITQYTRWSTVVLALVQGYAISSWLMGQSGPTGEALYYPQVGAVSFQVMTIVTLVAGTCFIMWLGEQISEKGIGEGACMIIYAGIAAGIPSGAFGLWTLVTNGQINGLLAIMIIGFLVAKVAFIIFMEVAQRRLPIHVSQKGGKQGQQVMGSFLPLKINLSGVIPPIFASSLLMFPATLSSFADAAWIQVLQDYLNPLSPTGGGLYNILFVGLIVFFCFFYTEIVFPPGEMADNLKKAGKFIPGIRAGKSTSDYIQKVMERVNVAGAIYLSAVCILPTILIARLNVPFYFGGTSLLILVGVALQMIDKVNAYRYEAMIKAAQKPRKRRVHF
ncbi:MAG: preprotein translocase subunit SecY [Bdellovibrionales bacterium]|nr:preprotein translocase subunit SecY [Bdellovibrionales bacterium]NQZ17696.1 preprotein translocase subunit SecY [Bdellovibrionales bacterium]